MRCSLVTVAAAFAAVGLSEAVPAPQNGVRYYFPREVKRQVLNIVDLGGKNNTSASTSTDLIDQLASGLKSAQSTSGSSEQTTPAGGIQIGQNTIISTTAASPSTDPTSSSDENLPASTTKGGLLDSLLPSATPTQTQDPSTESPTSTDGGLQITPTSDPGITGPTTAPATVSPTDSITSASDTASQTSDPGLQISPSITPTLPITLLPTDSSSSDSIVTPPPQSTTQGTQDPILTTPTLSVDPNPSTTGGYTGPTTGIPDTTTPSIPDSTTPPPVTNVPTTSQTDVPSQTPTIDTGINSSATPTGTPLTSVDSTSALPPSTSEVPTTQASPTSQASPSSDAVIASSTSFSSVQSLTPTATNTDTALSQVSSIVSASSTAGESSVASSTASTIPSSLPRIIVSPDATSQTNQANNDSLQLVQLGFTYGLNYPFVVSNSWAIQQIFNFLPLGLAHGIDAAPSDVLVSYLQPLNTLSRTGYITTLAMARIPVKDVNVLSVALLNPKADLWNNKNVTIKTLVNMLDPTIPLLAGQSPGDGSPVSNANGGQNNQNTNNGATSGTDDSSGNSQVKISSVGIGLGVVGGAAIYGVAMFMVARRYKKRKNAHKRASSVQSGSSNGSAARETNTLMAGARNSYGSRPQMAQTHQAGRESRTSDRSGQSGRTYISPPVTAENSLGWN